MCYGLTLAWINHPVMILLYTLTYAVVRRYSSSSLSTMRSEGHCRLSLRLTCGGLLNSVTCLFSCRISRL
jgi:hypothetical protein